MTDLDTWDPGSIRMVATAATDRATSLRDIAHNQDAIITNLEWQGLSYEAAASMATAISNSMLAHADECDQAGRDVASAASEVESIKAEWTRIQRMADRWGIGINTATGELHYVIPDDPAELAEVEHHVQIVHDAIVDLLRRADSTDRHLTSVVNNAISETAETVGDGSDVSPEAAKETVEKALAGDQAAAAQVKTVLDSINADQRAGIEPLTPMQASILSQMQSQQAGMSVKDLATAEQNMGGANSAMSDSWQLMSNPNIHFPKTDPGGVDNPKNMTSGGFGQLPSSVQNVLKSKGMSQFDEMSKLTDIVKDGNATLRQGGTALDRGMLNKATEMMNSPTFHGTPAGGKGGVVGVADDGVPVANDVLATAGQDHQAIHDILYDTAYSDDFMKGALTTDWADNGTAVGNMLGWTGDAVDGPDAKMAAETASAYADYVGNHDGDLLHIGNQTLGQLNPEAVRGLSHGLAPFIPDIAQTSSDLQHDGFADLDTAANVESGKMPVAKGIFSVLSSDRQASDFFNAEADREVVAEQNRWAADYNNGVDVSGDNSHLKNSMTLQGLVDSGTHNATDASGINKDDMNAAAYELKKSAYEMAFGTADAIVPGSGVFGQAMEHGLIGDAPTDQWSQHDIEDMQSGQATRQMLNALVQNGVEVNGLGEGFIAPPDEQHPDGPYVRSYEEYKDWAAASGTGIDDSLGFYDQNINSAVNDTVIHGVDGGVASQLDNMTDRYNAVTGDANPADDPDNKDEK
ncbi:TPR repeat region-containing protein [Mycolicibacterium palauense]|uniref:TPR repeat region-containing protein n=1 Tax=Mycolicibacterium palauense TaxID=2034511 RepID=UPI0011454428|nr:hypothetical protein [Mycolicibacterium palauense]